MPVRSPMLVLLIAACAAVTMAAAAWNSEAEQYWPQWRGPDATGASKHATPPVEWSESKNIRWKVEIPGRGSGTPVVWGDRLFVLTAVPVDETAAAPAGRGGSPGLHRYTVLALDRKTGTVAWQRVAREEAPHEGTHHEFGTYASSSAITDGEHVIAFFESRGLFAYDMNGTLVWEKDLGDKRMRNQFGEGTTPALHGDTVVVVWDHQGDSFIVALDKRTGEERWRAVRDEIDSWATPLIVEHGGRAQVVTSGMKQVRSYDLETGRLLWYGDGLTMNPIPSPVAYDGLVILTSGFRGSDLQAIRLAGTKDNVTGSGAMLWTLDRDTPYVPSPLVYNGILYLLKSNSGILSAFDAATGKPHYQLQRLNAAPNVFASPVAADGRVYITGQGGSTVVLKAGPAFEVLATNTLDDGFNGSAALVGDAIYLRGHEYLYAIAAD